MSLKIENLDLGVQIFSPQINLDERGFVTEIFRSDWLDFLINLYLNKLISLKVNLELFVLGIGIIVIRLIILWLQREK